MHKINRFGFLIEHAWTFLVALPSLPQWNVTPITAEVCNEDYTHRETIHLNKRKISIHLISWCGEKYTPSGKDNTRTFATLIK